MNDEIDNNTKAINDIPDNPAPYSKGFSIVSAIKDGLGLYAVNFFNFTILLILSQLALYSFTYIQTGHFAAASPTVMEDGAINYLITLIVSTALGCVFGIAVIFGALCSVSGRQVTIGTMLSRSISVFPRAFPAQIIASLLMIIGFIFLIVPGMMVALMLLPLTAVLAWENLGIMESLDRSRTLTNGYKWQLFGLLLIIALPIIILAMMFGFLSVESLQAATSTSGTILNIVFAAIFTAAMNCIVAVIYMQLKNENG